MKNKEQKWTVYFLHGKYAVFNDGEVWTLSWRKTNKVRKIKPSTTRQGYNQVKINGKLVYVHRLVAECFVKNPFPSKYKEINHINEDRTDNRAENLEWCDRKYNCNYGAHGKNASLAMKRYYKKHPEELKRLVENGRKGAKPVLQYTLDGKFVAEYPSLTEVGKQTGYDITCIGRCCNGKQETSHGYLWFYK